MKHVIPSNIKSLFWDVAKDKLDITANQKNIVERVLNYGTLSDWRWLVATYGINGVQEVLSARGALKRTNVRVEAVRLFSLLTKAEK